MIRPCLTKKKKLHYLTGSLIGYVTIDTVRMLYDRATGGSWELIVWFPAGRNLKHLELARK